MSDTADTVCNEQPDAIPESNQDTYSLLVKNPTDRPGTEPFTIHVEGKSTVRHLKALLAASYPGTPPVSSQRLIYAGKLLDDSYILKSVMASADHSVQHTVHLVVSNLHRSPASASGASASRTSAIPGPSIRAHAQRANSDFTSTMPSQQPNPNAGNPHYGTTFNPYIAFQQYTPGMDGQRLLFPTVPGMPPQDPNAYPFPYGPQYPSYPPPPSDVPGYDQPRHTAHAPQMPFAPVDPSNYAAHLQAMERIIGDSLAAQQNSAQEAAAAAVAQGIGEGADARAAAQAAASAAAAAAAMHAQAHVHAMANLDAGLRARLENNRGAPPVQNPAQAPGIGFGFQFGRGNRGIEGVRPREYHNQNQAIGERGPRVRRFVFQFEINWSLILKLVLVVYLLGQEGSPRRVYTLMALALAVYLWQTNRLGFVRRVAEAALPNPVQLFEALFPPEEPPSEGDAGPVDPVDTEQTANVSRSRAPNRFGRGAVILCFVYSFLYGFVSSLLPAWRPQALPRMEELLNPELNNNANNQAYEARSETDDDGNNEHAHAD